MLDRHLTVVEAPPAGAEAIRRRDGGTAPRPPEDPGRPSGAALVARIGQHHASVRRALPYLVAVLAKVAARHRARNAKLPALCDAGEELADALECRFDDEERDLFPALLEPASGRDPAARELDRLDRFHEELALLLSRIRWLADDFAMPAWGGQSYLALMEELGALEEGLAQRVQFDRSVLGPCLASLVPEVRRLAAAPA